MKILFIQDSLGTGGAERSNADLWYYLREKQVNIAIVVLEHRKEGIEKEIIDAGFKVTFLNGTSLKQISEMRHIIRDFKPDLVHSVLLKASFKVRILKLFMEFKHVESLVNCSYSKIRYADPKVNTLGLRFSQFKNITSQRLGTDYFIAITEEVKRHAIENIQIPDRKIKVIPRGRKTNLYIDGEGRESARRELIKELGLNDQAVIFTHVGRQEYQKGHMQLLQALSKRSVILEKNIIFIFCGREGNATPEIKSFLENNPIPHDIYWLGHRNDIQKILAASDVFVFPSLYEGLGGALIEAQAAALPVICSKIPVFFEVIKNNENAFMFEIDDHIQLLAYIKELSENKGLRDRMSKKSLENYNENYRVNTIHFKVEQFFKNIINDKSTIGYKKAI